MNKILLAALTLLSVAAWAERPFFAFDNGLTDVESVEEQAQLLRALGYDGICTRPANATPALFAAFDQHGVGVSASYVVVDPTAEKLPVAVVRHIESLKGRDTIIWLGLSNEKAEATPAVAMIRRVYDLATANGLEVVLYPHINFRTDTIARTERLRDMADRPDLGISFNLCHFLAQTDAAKLEETIKTIAPHLKIVLLSGANRIPAPKPDWDQLILPLGEGNFEMMRVFRTLDEIGYEGPVGLQCYRVPGPATQHLKTSINAWRKYHDHP